MEDARALFLQIPQQEPTHAHLAWYSLASLDSAAGDVSGALLHAQQSIAANPAFPNAHLALSILLSKTGRYQEAWLAVNEALRLAPDYAEAKSHQTLLAAAIRTPSVAASAQAEWPGVIPQTLSEVIAVAELSLQQGQILQACFWYQAYIKAGRPDMHGAFFNLGVIMCGEERRAEAEAYFRQAVHLAPTFLLGYLNLGTVLEQLDRPEEALDIWQRGCEQHAGDDQDTLIKLYNNLGRLNEQLRRFEKAEAALYTSLQLDLQQPPVIQHWYHLRQKQCKWPVLHGFPGQDFPYIRKHVSALAMLAATDDPAEQLACSKRFVEEKVGKFPRMVAKGHQYGHERIRIAFLSSDLSMHAVSLLTVELFETLDRNVFEVYAFCWSKEDGTAFRQRVIHGFDHFFKVGHLSDQAIADMVVSHEIDVVVDLQGITSGARPDIVARGPAPMQITWLGFPGPTALPHVDYVIADPFIFPEELKPYFTEAPLYMDTLFQVSDSRREVGPTPPRSALGLPEDAFVYCALNNNYKITPEMLTCWMQILHAVPHAVLWLLEDNEWSKANLTRAAMAHGITPERLIFAGRVLPQDYLGRFAAADLFLDTCPYNAGTTANDALWAGLPLLTLSGKTYVSRMAGSLLHSAGLDNLITFSPADYQKRAIELAGSHSMELQQARKRLSALREAGELFQTKRFCTEFANRLHALVASQQSAIPKMKT